MANVFLKKNIRSSCLWWSREDSLYHTVLDIVHYFMYIWYTLYSVGLFHYDWENIFSHYIGGLFIFRLLMTVGTEAGGIMVIILVQY